MKNLTNYDVSELLCMLADIRRLIDRYCHVSDKLPGLKSQIEKKYSDLCTELDKRQSE